jgi:hypothetical protein
MRTPSPTLPPWKSISVADQQRLFDWTIQQLDYEEAERGRHRGYRGPLLEEEKRRIRLDCAIQRARHGDVASLRIIYPQIADFIHLPPRKRGQHVTSYPTNTDRFLERHVAEHLVDQVKRVHALWRQHYDGRWKRRGRPTAAQIVAVREHLDEQQVVAAVRLLSR